jgi:hypothetical protein
MFQRDRQARVKLRNHAGGAAQSVQFGAFDVHLDEVNPRQVK